MKYEGEYFVKHTPSVPFIIISKNSKWNSVYLKTGPNPKRQKRNWKGRTTNDEQHIQAISILVRFNCMV